MSPQYLKQLSAYADTVVERKRRNPADDILSVIVHAQLDDGSPQLNNQELRAFFNLLFPAGAETTRGPIAGGLLAVGHAVGRGRFGTTVSRTARLMRAPSETKKEIDGAARASRFAYGPALAAGAIAAALLVK
jgi:hypothetical protein